MNGRAGLVQGSMTSAFVSLRKLRSSFFSAVILLTRVISRLQSQLCGLPVHPIWYCTAVVTPLSFSVQRFSLVYPLSLSLQKVLSKYRLQETWVRILGTLIKMSSILGTCYTVSNK